MDGLLNDDPVQDDPAKNNVQRRRASIQRKKKASGEIGGRYPVKEIMYTGEKDKESNENKDKRKNKIAQIYKEAERQNKFNVNEVMYGEIRMGEGPLVARLENISSTVRLGNKTKDEIDKMKVSYRTLSLLSGFPRSTIQFLTSKYDTETDSLSTKTPGRPKSGLENLCRDIKLLANLATRTDNSFPPELLKEVIKVMHREKNQEGKTLSDRTVTDFMKNNKLAGLKKRKGSYQTQARANAARDPRHITSLIAVLNHIGLDRTMQNEKFHIEDLPHYPREYFTNLDATQMPLSNQAYSVKNQGEVMVTEEAIDYNENNATNAKTTNDAGGYIGLKVYAMTCADGKLLHFAMLVPDGLQELNERQGKTKSGFTTSMDFEDTETDNSVDNERIDEEGPTSSSTSSSHSEPQVKKKNKKKKKIYRSPDFTMVIGYEADWASRIFK